MPHGLDQPLIHDPLASASATLAVLVSGGPWTLACLRVGVAVLLAAGFAWLLARANIAGGRPSAILGGALIASLLLGPVVLGKAAPDTHAALHTGAAAERRAYEQTRFDLTRQVEGELFVLREIGASPEAVAEHAREARGLIEDQLAPEREALRRAERRHRSALLLCVGVVAVVTLALLACASALAVRNRPARKRRAGTSTIPAEATAACLAGLLALLLLPPSPIDGLIDQRLLTSATLAGLSLSVLHGLLRRARQRRTPR